MKTESFIGSIMSNSSCNTRCFVISSFCLNGQFEILMIHKGRKFNRQKSKNTRNTRDNTGGKDNEKLS